jgi:predicted phosphodiesterase
MKILFISDLHANPIAVKGIFKQESKWDLLICLGDYLDRGHFPEELIQLMMSTPHISLPGNHDFHIINTIHSNPSIRESSHESINYYRNNGIWYKLSAAELSHKSLDFILDIWNGPRYRVLDLDGWSYVLCHSFCNEWAFTKNPNKCEYIIPEGKGDVIEFIEKTVGIYDPSKFYRVVTGHRHYRWHLRLSDRLEYLNPGSTAYVRRGEVMKGAEYLVIEDGKVHLKTYEYAWERYYNLSLQSKYDGCYPKGIDMP